MLLQGAWWVLGAADEESGAVGPTINISILGSVGKRRVRLNSADRRVDMRSQQDGSPRCSARIPVTMG